MNLLKKQNISKFNAKALKKSDSNNLISYILLVAPGILIYSLIVVFPTLFSIGLSFTKWSGTGTPLFTGLSNYKKMFMDPVFLHGLRNNLLIVMISVFGQIPIGIFLAYLVYRKLVKATQFFQAMIFLPIAISVIIVAILWNQIFAPGGLVTSLMRIITNDPRYVVNVFENKTFAIVPILFVILWYYIGIYMVMFVANMRKIPEHQIEAAILDGATEMEILIKVILPQLRTVVLTTIIFAISGSLKSFGLIFAMTGGGPAHYTEVASIYMYLNTFKYYNYGFGNAVSTVIILISVVFIGLLQLLFNKLEKKYG